jgi:hypothetical protein
MSVKGARALIVGVNDYPLQRLTSAVNDALAFRQALINLRLVESANITLLTSPQTAFSAGPATKEAIRDALYEAYANGASWPRWFFHYSGHGLMAFGNSERSKVRTALVPVDADLGLHSDRLIDFNELLDLMELAGPKEQNYFIDACRDIDYDKQPGVVPFGWPSVDQVPGRIQRCIYAVSPLGKAKGAEEGMGAWTTDIVAGLTDQYLALEYDQVADTYQITMDSLFAYVSARAAARITAETVWMKKYVLPSPFSRGSGAAPLRTFANVPPIRFTVHITPDAAAAGTEIVLERSRSRLDANHCYPNRLNHEAVELEPQHHRLSAKSRVGRPVPAELPIDPRTTQEITISVQDEPPQPSFSDTGRIPPTITPCAALPKADASAPSSSVVARSFERTADITLRSLDAPYRMWRGSGVLSEDVTPGPYHIEFRLGSEIYSQSDLFVGHSEIVTIEANPESSPLLMEALNLGNSSDDGHAVVVSDSIGNMQAGLLATILPIIGIEPFDFGDTQFPEWSNLVEFADPADYGNRPVSVVVAIDGNGWEAPIAALLDGLEVDLQAPEELTRRIPLNGLSSSVFGSLFEEDPGRGLQRIRSGIARAPANSFTLRVFVPDIGDVFIASASLADRLTVVTLLVRPDGSVDVGQSLLDFPNNYACPPSYDPETQAPYTYGKLLRLSQVAQMLYESDQLFEKWSNEPGGAFARFIDDLLYAKFQNPVLGCMGYYAARRAGPHGVGLALLNEVARNLYRYFGSLADVRVITALHSWDGEGRSGVFEDIVDSGIVPMLAESVQHLARYAIVRGDSDAAIVDVARSIAPAQPWTKSLQPFRAGQHVLQRG